MLSPHTALLLPTESEPCRVSGRGAGSAGRECLWNRCPGVLACMPGIPATHVVAKTLLISPAHQALR